MAAETADESVLVAEIEAMYLAGTETRSMERYMNKKYSLTGARFKMLLKQILNELADEIASQPINAVVARADAMLIKACKVARDKKDAKAMGVIAERMVNIRVRTDEISSKVSMEKDENGNTKVVLAW